MHQDQTGRWVSDDGRYLWSGEDWIEVTGSESRPASGTAPSSPEPRGSARPAAPSAPPADTTAAGAESAAAPPAAGAPVPPLPTGPAAAARARGRAGTRRRRSAGRRGAVLLILLLVVALGVGIVLLVGRDTAAVRTTAPPDTPAQGDATPGLSASPTSPVIVDEQQRRDRVQRALVHVADVPGATEERVANPTDVFLPCRATALTPPADAVLAGTRVSNADFTYYAGQTVVGFATARQAADALGRIRTVVGQCAAYDYHYANSARVDRITHTDIAPDLPVGDGGVYLVEVDTPSNYAGSPTSYSYAYVRRGQFLVRLTTTTASKADRPGIERLLGVVLGRLG